MGRKKKKKNGKANRTASSSSNGLKTVDITPYLSNGALLVEGRSIEITGRDISEKFQEGKPVRVSYRGSVLRSDELLAVSIYDANALIVEKSNEGDVASLLIGKPVDFNVNRICSGRPIIKIDATSNFRGTIAQGSDCFLPANAFSRTPTKGVNFVADVRSQPEVAIRYLGANVVKHDLMKGQILVHFGEEYFTGIVRGYGDGI